MTAEPSTLLLFTGSYPYDRELEATFLEPELPRLAEAFERIVLIPTHRGGARADPPSSVGVEEGLAEDIETRARTIRTGAMVATQRSVWDDLRAHPGLMAQPRAIARLGRSAARAARTRDWVIEYVRRQPADASRTVAYTFWCDATTTGLCLAKAALPGLVVVSRAHGTDLYAERHRPPYLPLRDMTLANLDRLFPDSGRGVRYVADRYPWFATRCELARMGVDDPGFGAQASGSGRCVLVSCSRIVPLKRLDLVLQAIAVVARQRPTVAFEWHHFGDGELRTDLEREARSAMPPNATVSFPGWPGIPELMRFYRTNPVDVFLNASASEGTPVAIMEAASCGIPVVATSVGGNPEIVSEENGALVGENPSPEEYAAAILRFVDDQEWAAARRSGSRRVWARSYDAARNYASFARRLRGLQPRVAGS